MIPAVTDPVDISASIVAKTNDFQVYGPSAELVIGTYDTLGVYWWWDDIEGWFDSPPFTAVVAPLGNANYGTWNQRFPRIPKTYTIKGFCYAGSKAAAWAARRRLMTYWGDPDRVFDLIVDEPDGAKRAQVRLTGPISAPWKDSIGRAKGFTYEIPLVAKDPLKYSLDVLSDTTSTSSPSAYGLTFPITFPITFTATGGGELLYAELFNSGDEASSPLSVLEGEIAAGWRIQNLDDLNSQGVGKTLWVNRSLGPGDRLELDHKTSLARLNGSPVDVNVFGEWWSLRPGRNRIQLSSPSATTAALTITGYSAWR